MTTYKLHAAGVMKDGVTLVPFDTDNRDYVEYLEWVAGGNTPEPQFTQAELDEIKLAEDTVREIAWRDSQLVDIAEQLLKLEDEDPTAIGTTPEWRMYRIKVRIWTEGAEGYPNIELRPVRPVGD